MEKRQRKSVQESHFSKFLKPGALARIRDSKIIARSVRSGPLTRLAPPSSPEPAQAVAQPETVGHQIRFVPYRVSGPRYLLRKRLVGCKSVYFENPGPDLTDPVLDLGFGSDLVAWH